MNQKIPSHIYIYIYVCFKLGCIGALINSLFIITDRDCAAGVCSAGYCSASCDSLEDTCTHGMTCLGGQCHVDCEEDMPCPDTNKQTCLNGVCVEKCEVCRENIYSKTLLGRLLCSKSFSSEFSTADHFLQHIVMLVSIS